MDFESTLETISELIPENLDLTSALEDVKEYLPEVMDIRSIAKDLVPAEIDFAGTIHLLQGIFPIQG